NLTYRPDAVGFDEEDLPGTDEDVDNDDAIEDGKFFRYMAAVVVSWDVEGPFFKDVWIDGTVQSVEVLPAGPVEPTPENMRLIGAPGLSAIHAALREHTMGNRKRKPKR